MLIWIEQMMRAGGWVMYPLAAMSVLALALIFERIGFWSSTHRRRRFAKLDAITRALEKGDLDAIAKAARKDSSIYGVFVRGMLRHRDAGLDDARAEIIARDLIESARTRVERFSVTLSTIITAAPMLGILGTVTGIIASFRVLGDDRITDPSAVAGGIAEALLTTAFGLTIALVTLFPYMVFRAHAERCFARLELLAAALIIVCGSHERGTSQSDRSG